MATNGPGAVRQARTTAGRAMSVAAEGDWRSTLARFGLVGKGVLYAALGTLAINVANGSAASQTAGRRGAIELVASQPFGQWLIVLLTASLFALAAWQLILAFTGDPVEGSEGKDRAKYAAKAIVYLGAALTSLSVVMAHWGSGSSGIVGAGGGGANEQQAATTVMSWPGGPWIVGIVGLAVMTLGIYQVRAHSPTRRCSSTVACRASSR